MKSTIFFISVLFFLCSFNALNAQDKLSITEDVVNPTPSELTPDQRYQKEAIFLKYSFGGIRYVKNGIPHRLGFQAKNIKKEFGNNKLALAEFKKYRRTKVVADVASFTGIAIAYIAGRHYVKRTGLNSPPTDGETSGYFLGVGGMLVASTVGTYKTFNHLQQAIHLHNQAICEGK